MSDERTALYRYFDRQGRLLYVGISTRPMRRLEEHRANGAAWVTDYHRMTVERFSDRTSALAAEKRAIQSEHPAWNVQHNLRRQQDGMVETILCAIGLQWTATAAFNGGKAPALAPADDRRRAHAILSLPEAYGREHLAARLAVTGMSPADAATILRETPTRAV